MDGKSDKKTVQYPLTCPDLVHIFFCLFANVHRHQHPIRTRLPHFIHTFAPGTLPEPLFLPHLPLLLPLQPNRQHIPNNMYLPPACSLDAYGRPGAGCEPEASTKAAPHLLVFAAQSVGWEGDVRAMASGVGRCCRWRAWLYKYIIYVILNTREDADCTEHFYISLCPRCTL